MNVMMDRRKVRWNNPKNSLCAWGYVAEIVPVMVYEDIPKKEYRIVVGDIKLKKTFVSLDEGIRRVERKWQVYAGMVKEKIERDGIVEWQGVNQFGYEQKIVCGIMCRLEPFVSGGKKGQYWAVIGAHRDIVKERKSMQSAAAWIDGYLVKAIERRMGE